MPVYTNKHNIPQEIVSAIQNDSYTKGDADISVTSLLLPPRIYQLRQRHWEEIEEDISDRLFSLYGQVIHGIFERSDDMDAIHEERLSINVNGWKVSGQTDLYKRKADGSHVLRDYKFTSAYVSNFDLKPEWVEQLNLYALMWKSKGFDVDTAQIVAVYRDWRKMESERNQSYPPPVEIFDVPIWNAYAAGRFLEERVQMHIASSTVPDDVLPDCTPEEQWRKPEKWAVMKEGRKTAVKLYDSLEEAENAISDTPKVYVEHRPSTPTRCEHFCNVSPFCNQYNSKRKAA